MSELRLPRAGSSGTLLLIGGGEFSFGETKEADELLLDTLPGSNRRIAFIPAASGSTEYAKHLGEWLRSIDSAVEVVHVPLFRRRDAKRRKNLEMLRSAGSVYIGGGVTDRISEVVRDTPLREVLLDVLERGGVIAGIGAGASIVGRWARSHDAPGRPVEGLALLPECVIESGFDPSDDVMLRRLMSLPEIRIGVGLPPRSSVAVAADGAVRIIGDESVVVARKP